MSDENAAVPEGDAAENGEDTPEFPPENTDMADESENDEAEESEEDGGES